MAQSSSADAAEDYARAVQLYNEGRNREALDAFNLAIEKSEEPVYVCNRAVVLMTLEEYDRAIEDLTYCRDRYEMPTEEKAGLDAKLQALKVFELTLRPHARDVAERIANPPKALDITPDSEVVPSVVRTPPLRSAGWVSLGLGAGALLGTAALEVASREDVDRYTSDCMGALDASSAQACEVLQGTLGTQQRIARVLLVSGAALSITGTALLLVTRQRSPERSWRLIPSLSVGQAQMTWQVTF